MKLLASMWIHAIALSFSILCPLTSTTRNTYTCIHGAFLQNVHLKKSLTSQAFISKHVYMVYIIRLGVRYFEGKRIYRLRRTYIHWLSNFFSEAFTGFLLKVTEYIAKTLMGCSWAKHNGWREWCEIGLFVAHALIPSVGATGGGLGITDWTFPDI